MRKRKIKFALELKDGQEARSMEELREYFDLGKMIGYFHDGKLAEWLEDRLYQDEAEKIKALDVNDVEVGRKLCEILGAEYADTEDVETIVWRKERTERLKQYTADQVILEHVDWVAFDQDDLEDIMREEDRTSTIYLCQNTFYFPSGIYRREHMHYIGIGKNVKVIVKNKEPVDFKALQTVFENIEVQGEFIASDCREKGLDNKPIPLAEFTWFLFEEERKLTNKFCALDLAVWFLPRIGGLTIKSGFLFDKSLDRISVNLFSQTGIVIDESEQIVCGFICDMGLSKYALCFTDCAMIYSHEKPYRIPYKDIKNAWSKGGHVYVETDYKHDFPMLAGDSFDNKVAFLLKYASNPSSSVLTDKMYLSVMMRRMGRVGTVNLNTIV